MAAVAGKWKMSRLALAAMAGTGSFSLPRNFANAADPIGALICAPAPNPASDGSVR